MYINSYRSSNFGFEGSISSDGFACDMDSVAVDNNEFDAVTGVYISFSDGVYDVLGGVEHDLFILSELLHKEVMADELVVQDGSAQL